MQQKVQTFFISLLEEPFLFVTCFLKFIIKCFGGRSEKTHRKSLWKYPVHFPSDIFPQPSQKASHTFIMGQSGEGGREGSEQGRAGQPQLQRDTSAAASEYGRIWPKARAKSISKISKYICVCVCISCKLYYSDNITIMNNKNKNLATLIKAGKDQ